MDLALWRVAETVRGDGEGRRLVADLGPAALASRYASGGLPPALTAALDGFLAAYGMRGVGEIDLGRPRWSDDPTEVLATVQRYLDIPEDQSPPAQFARGAEAATRAIERLGPQTGGVADCWPPSWPDASGRSPAAALPKFTIIRMMGVARAALVASGHDLVEAGVLGSPNDIFLLRLAELEALRGGSAPASCTPSSRSAVTPWTVSRDGRRCRGCSWVTGAPSTRVSEMLAIKTASSPGLRCPRGPSRAPCAWSSTRRIPG